MYTTYILKWFKMFYSFLSLLECYGNVELDGNGSYGNWL